MLVTAWAAGCGAPAQVERRVVETPATRGASEIVRAPNARLVPPQSVVDSAVRAFNAHDAATLAGLYAPATTSLTLGPRGWRKEIGRGSIENGAALLFAAFPDVTKTTTGLYASRDTVVQEWATSGTHSGEFMGVKATGHRVGFCAVSIYKIDGGGQIVVERTYFDHLTLARQIGLVKEPVRQPPTIPAGSAFVTTASDSPAEARNEDTVRSFFAWLDGPRTPAALARLLAPSATFTRASDGQETAGLSAIQSSYDALYAVFPDAAFSVVDLISAGDFVVAEVSMRGTQKGAVGGLPPTNKTVTLHRVEVFELHDDTITRARGYSSTLELRGQLDGLPSLSTMGDRAGSHERDGGAT
jgi:predicted ester cyclase